MDNPCANTFYPLGRQAHSAVTCPSQFKTQDATQSRSGLQDFSMIFPLYRIILKFNIRNGRITHLINCTMFQVEPH